MKTSRTLQEKQNLAKACEVLKHRFYSFASKYYYFNFRTRNGYLSVECKYNGHHNDPPKYVYVYAVSKNGPLNYIVCRNNEVNSEILDENATACILDYSKNYDIVLIGVEDTIVLVNAGETLESLCIEYDMKAGIL